ncbi:MAG: signal peptidase II [Chloroflexi bacterium]|nr:MAG: signal peptidase II [Chloroflexota bacterium]HDN78951.1 signal peptidase II [Chloroflexota bacterium]
MGVWQRLIVPGVALIVLSLDQFTKALVRKYIPLGESWAPLEPVGKFFTFTHVTNRGIAFGLLPQWGDYFLYLGVGVILAILLYQHRLDEGSCLLRLSLGFQLGGALGNLLDRVRYGYVMDFIDFKVWPVFNVADSAITIGALLLVYYFLFEKSD